MRKLAWVRVLAVVMVPSLFACGGAGKKDREVDPPGSSFPGGRGECAGPVRRGAPAVLRGEQGKPRDRGTDPGAPHPVQGGRKSGGDGSKGEERRCGRSGDEGCRGRRWDDGRPRDD